MLNIVVLFVGIINLLRKPIKADEHTVVLPGSLLIIGTVCCAMFLIPSIIIFMTSGFDMLALIFTAFALLAAGLIVAFINCRITYDENSFTAKNFFGIKRKYSYNDIKAIKGNSKDVKLYVGTHTVHIDELAIGKDEFLLCAKKQYCKHNNGNQILNLKSKCDIFNGNVNNPGEFIFVYALVFVLCAGMIIFIAINSATENPGGLYVSSLAFSRCEIHEENLRLYVDNESMYYGIPAYEKVLSDADKFILLCESGMSFDVGYAIYDKADTPHYGIESIIGKDGAIYLSTKAIHDYQRSVVRTLYLIFGGFELIWLFYIFMSIYIGRHPQKFSRRFIRLFFKDGYIKISNWNK